MNALAPPFLKIMEENLRSFFLYLFTFFFHGKQKINKKEKKKINFLTSHFSSLRTQYNITPCLFPMIQFGRYKSDDYSNKFIHKALQK